MPLTEISPSNLRDWKKSLNLSTINDDMLAAELCNRGFAFAEIIKIEGTESHILVLSLCHNKKHLRVSWENKMRFYGNKSINITVMEEDKTVAYFPTVLKDLWKSIRQMWEEEMVGEGGEHREYWQRFFDKSP